MSCGSRERSPTKAILQVSQFKGRRNDWGLPVIKVRYVVCSAVNEGLCYIQKRSKYETTELTRESPLRTVPLRSTWMLCTNNIDLFTTFFILELR